MSWIDAAGLAGGVGWFSTYMTILYVSWRDRTYAMPMLAMVTNLAWEFLFAFIYRDVGGRMQEWINVVWFGLDLVILYTFLRFWRADFPDKLKAYMWPILLGSMAMAMALLIGIIQQFGKDYGAAYTAYGANLMMSALFLVMLLRRGDSRGQSIWIAIFKMLGTAGTSISQYLYDPTTTALTMAYIEIFLLDALYVGLLSRTPRWQHPSLGKG
jgi:hypothetical protein